MRKSIDVLLVEDNPADADLTRDTLEASKLALNLSVVGDGAEALEFLYKKGGYAAASTPDLILLDLNLPGKDGREVLAEIKKDAALCKIPVVILTSSQAEADIVKTYQLGANCYITKPVGLTSFQTIVQAVSNFWFTVVKLPPKHG